MTDLELLFSTLGERLAKEATIKRDSEGVAECRQSANEGGSIAGRDAVRFIGDPIVSKKSRGTLLRN